VHLEREEEGEEKEPGALAAAAALHESLQFLGGRFLAPETEGDGMIKS